MSIMMREIQLAGDRFESFVGVEPGNRLEGLSRLNVFIGPNNSGKSRLLRTIFSEDELRCATDAPEIQALRANIADLQNTAEKVRKKSPEIVVEYSGAFEYISQLRCPLHTRGHRFIDEEFGGLIQSHSILRTNLKHLRLETRAEMLRQPLSDFENNLTTAKKYEPSKQGLHRIYIPTLRGLRPIEGEKDLYRKRTVSDYFTKEIGTAVDNLQAIEGDSIVTGLSFYTSVRRYLLGTLEERKAIRDYEDFLSRSFFDGEEVTLIPREGQDVLYVKVGSEKEQPIYHLVDGIQQVIIQTWPLILHQDKHLILCIEEPELYLHPGYQRLLIERFLDTPKGEGGRQVFVATHSQQFLDMTLDHENISVYRLSKSKPEEHDEGDGEWVPSFQVTLRSGHDRNILEELGVRNSSVLLANCTIWVEGITDRMYIRHFLKLWLKAQSKEERLFQEDIHYAFVEYSGNNITHWSFLDDSGDALNAERLCGDVFLIADKDSGKEKRHEDLKAFLGDRACILDCLEIENILTPGVIRGIITDYEGDRVQLRNFKHKTYASKKLGKFIENSAFKKPYISTRKGRYAAKSGTVKDKRGFASKAIKLMDSFEDLSDMARDVTERVVAFIREMNPR